MVCNNQGRVPIVGSPTTGKPNPLLIVISFRRQISVPCTLESQTAFWFFSYVVLGRYGHRQPCHHVTALGDNAFGRHG